jgi:fatty-acyl-CoA synthase
VVGGDPARLPGAIGYEEFIAGGDPSAVDMPALDERDAAAMCYTSGTTGRPKGVLYSHRSILLHSFCAAMTDALGVGESDTVLAVVPMFHANAWGLPYATTMVGAKVVLPGPHLDPASIVELFLEEGVTVTAGVPTIWMGMLQYLDANPGKFDLSRIRLMIVGGSAVPRAMIEAYEKRHGLKIVQAWGMTETSPIGSIGRLPAALASASQDEQYAFRAKQGRPAPFVEVRARGDAALVPWDGKSMGELEVRGPWVASGYYRQERGDDRLTDDGWFRTGDIVTIASDGCIHIQDRAKDLIKSGGEWISSVALENAIMAHPAVAEAAVIAVRDPKWDERPLAAVVLRSGATLAADELRAFLADKVAKWWLPERIEFVDEIPKTSVGKFMKSVLRQRYAHA